MVFLSGIWEFLKGVARAFWDACKRIYAVVTEFFSTVVNNFRNLFRNGKIRQGKDTPFITKGETLGQLVHDAPNIPAGVFAATYNEETEEVENQTIVEGQLDSQTKSALERSENGIVTLS
ncbi:MAG: hypothetical protein MJZ19_10160 [Paludibacteraceae bacterium]|nr:hypothetical protein [Paludibacteraceae bacterium]